MKTTRKEKRMRQVGLNVFSDMIKIINHRFNDFLEILDKISDPRHPGYIKYDQKIIIMQMILAVCWHLKSMREMNVQFNNDMVIKNFSILFLMISPMVIL